MALSSILKTEIARAENNPYYLLFGDLPQFEDENIWRFLGGNLDRYSEILRDGHTKAVFESRERNVTSREWEVTPASKSALDIKAADLVKAQLQALSLDQVSADQMDAILKGFSVGELLWEESDGEIRVKAIRAKPQSQFRFIRPEGKEGAVLENGWELRLLESLSAMAKGVALPNRKFLVTSYGSRIGNPYGLGLGRQLWWLSVIFKKEIIKSRLIFLDKFASPTPYGKYPATGKESDAQMLMEFLGNISEGAYGAIPSDFEVDLMEASRSSTNDIYESALAWCDAAISKVVLGETLSTELAGNSGSRAAAETHQAGSNVFLAKSDSDRLSEGVLKTLCQWIVELNIPEAKPPMVWRLFPELKPPDPEKEREERLNARISREKMLMDLGYKITFEKVKEVYGDGYRDTEAEEAAKQKDSFFSASEPISAPIDIDSGAGEIFVDFGTIIDRVLKWNDLELGVEYLPGQVRFPGRKTSKKLKSAYGHIRRYVGADGEALDCYLAPEVLQGGGSSQIYEISQLSPEDGDFDEHKFMLGYEGLQAAKTAYLTEMPIEFFGGIKAVSRASLEAYHRDTIAKFAEADEERDYAELVSDRLSRASSPIFSNWLETVQQAVSEIGRSKKSDPEKFQELSDRFNSLYAEINTASYADMLGEAMNAVYFGGRYEVIQENDDMK